MFLKIGTGRSFLAKPFSCLQDKTLKQVGENGNLRNAAMSAFEEGAPFMGTALAEYRQCIDASAAAIFTFLKIFRDPDGFSGFALFQPPKLEAFFSFAEGCTFA